VEKEEERRRKPLILNASSLATSHRRLKKVSRRQLLPVSPTTENRRTAGQFDCNSPNRHLANSQKKSAEENKEKEASPPSPSVFFA
jgi:hypothetical protein